MKKKIFIIAALCVAALSSSCGSSEGDKQQNTVNESNISTKDTETDKHNTAGENNNDSEAENKATDISEFNLEDGMYEVEVTLSGGTKRASIDSPTLLKISDGNAVAQIKWSSPYYDYMIVNGEKFMPVNTEGNSVFEIPIKVFDGDISVIADTTAMSQPHEIEYTLVFSSDTVKRVE